MNLKENESLKPFSMFCLKLYHIAPLSFGFLICWNLMKSFFWFTFPTTLSFARDWNLLSPNPNSEEKSMFPRFKS